MTWPAHGGSGTPRLWGLASAWTFAAHGVAWLCVAAWLGLGAVLGPDAAFPQFAWLPRSLTGGAVPGHTDTFATLVLSAIETPHVLLSLAAWYFAGDHDSHVALHAGAAPTSIADATGSHSSTTVAGSVAGAAAAATVAGGGATLRIRAPPRGWHVLAAVAVGACVVLYDEDLFYSLLTYAAVAHNLLQTHALLRRGAGLLASPRGHHSGGRDSDDDAGGAGGERQLAAAWQRAFAADAALLLACQLSAVAVWFADPYRGLDWYHHHTWHLVPVPAAAVPVAVLVGAVSATLLAARVVAFGCGSADAIDAASHQGRATADAPGDAADVAAPGDTDRDNIAAATAMPPNAARCRMSAAALLSAVTWATGVLAPSHTVAVLLLTLPHALPSIAFSVRLLTHRFTGASTVRFGGVAVTRGGGVGAQRRFVAVALLLALLGSAVEHVVVDAWGGDAAAPLRAAAVYALPQVAHFVAEPLLLYA